jgi:UDP-N-acetylmuramate--alanine ligase
VNQPLSDDQRAFKRVHFVGVAGSGMASIALVAHCCGIKVSGSDLNVSSYVQPLLDAGVPVIFEHSAANVSDPELELVVVSTAIPSTNPELIAAAERGIEVWPRARMLAYLGKDRKVLAVSGTHGKTTTSALLTTALIELGADPSFLLGGIPTAFETSARYRPGPYMVMEADESDASFVWLNPQVIIITNIEADHLDHFESLEDIKRSFLAFLDKLAPEGMAIICADSAGLEELVAASNKPYITYGRKAGADVQLVVDEGNASQPHVLFSLSRPFDRSSESDQGPPTPVSAITGSVAEALEPMSSVSTSASSLTTRPDSCALLGSSENAAEPADAVSLELGAAPGIHNLLNATAVLAALDWLGFDRRAAARACVGFAGVHRRFEHIGMAAGVLVVDDYGHHPTEVSATLAAAQGLGFTQVHLLFQPHRYTRTQAFLREFAAAFDDADSITLMDIYTAGEAPIAGIDSTVLLRAIKAHNPGARARLISKRDSIAAAMADVAASGSVIITMGAGDVTQLAPQILAALQHCQGRASATEEAV